MKAIQTYRADCGVKLSTYVFICAKNEVRMYLRKGAAKIRSASVVSLDADIDDDQKRKVIDTIFDSNCPIDKLENDLYAKSIFRIAMQIVDYEMSKEAGIVVHRTMDGITQSQIARELNVSQSKVSKLLSASRKQHKEKLNAAGFDGF